MRYALNTILYGMVLEVILEFGQMDIGILGWHGRQNKIGSTRLFRY
jgi:hypothetical protein